MRAVIGIVIVLLIGLIACGRSDEGNTFTDYVKKIEAQNEEGLLQLKEKFNPVLFPGKDLSGDSFTIEFQYFFKQVAERYILFEGYLNDIEETADGLFVTFICPLHMAADYFTDSPTGRIFDFRKSGREINDSVVIAFRLKATPDQLEKIWTERRIPDPNSPWSSGMRTHCSVIAKTDTINKIRHYETQGGHGTTGDVDVSIDVFPSYIVKGQLIDVYIEGGSISEFIQDDEDSSKEVR